MMVFLIAKHDGNANAARQEFGEVFQDRLAPGQKLPSESVPLFAHWSDCWQPLESVDPGHNSLSSPHSVVQTTGQSSPVLSFVGPFKTCNEARN